MTTTTGGATFLRTAVALAAIVLADDHALSAAGAQSATSGAWITRTPVTEPRITEGRVTQAGAPQGEPVTTGACSAGQARTHATLGATSPDADGDASDDAPAPGDTVVARANAAARQLPSISRFMGARQVYRYAPGALYLLEASPAFVSMLLLEPGESLIDIAAGDTTRWTVTQTVSEAHGEPRVIVLVKPQAGGLHTNIVLVSDRRTYLVEARSQEGDSYLAQMAWCYPTPLGTAPPSNSVTVSTGRYRIRTVKGRSPVWMPTQVYDDGRRTWIEFPEAAGSNDLPPLFIVTPEGVELVNYRVLEAPRRYMVDRLFDRAELRVGRRSPVIVRIDRRKDAS